MTCGLRCPLPGSLQASDGLWPVALLAGSWSGALGSAGLLLVTPGSKAPGVTSRAEPLQADLDSWGPQVIVLWTCRLGEPGRVGVGQRTFSGEASWPQRAVVWG